MTFRSFTLTLAALLLSASGLLATGISITKSCPGNDGLGTLNSGQVYSCTFSLTASGGTVGTSVDIDSLTETVPSPGGTPYDLQCFFPDGSLAATLRRGVSGQSTCSGSTAPRAAPTCSGSQTDVTDQIFVSWTDQFSVSGFDHRDAVITVFACTPTPTRTPTPTNTPNPGATATPTPTRTPTPGPPLNLNVQKSCNYGGSPVPAGGLVTCIFSVQNVDFSNAVTGLIVNNLYPWPEPGGPDPGHIPCYQGASPVTTLQPFGTPGGGDTCQGTFVESVNPVCPSSNTAIPDRLAAIGQVTVGGSTYDSIGFTDASYIALGCTPTPTITPTPTFTPTPTITPTPTNTPTGPTPTPTNTPTGTLTPATNTPTFTPTITPTPTTTPTPCPSCTPTRTNTPNGTPSATPTRTWTPGFTPSFIPTNTPTPTPAASCGTRVTGKIRVASGDLLTVNGVVWFELNQNGNAACCSPAYQIGPAPPITGRLVNGVIQDVLGLVGNDCIQPAGSYYHETVISSTGVVVLRRDCVVTGAVWDVGTCTSPGLPAATPTRTPTRAGTATPGVPSCQGARVTNITGPATYAVVDTDGYLFVDTTAGAVTINLPPSPVSCRIIDIKKTGGSNAVTVNGNGHNIDGAGTRTITTILGAIEVCFDTVFGWGII